MASDTIDRLTDKFRTNRERFEAFCRSLSDEELERPVPDSTYRVKDFASHLATLDTELVRWFEAVRQGRSDEATRSADGSPFDVDQFNDAVVAERRDWSLDQIFEEAAANREHMLAALEALDDEAIERTVHFPGDNKRRWTTKRSSGRSTSPATTSAHLQTYRLSCSCSASPATTHPRRRHAEGATGAGGGPRTQGVAG